MSACCLRAEIINPFFDFLEVLFCYCCVRACVRACLVCFYPSTPCLVCFERVEC